MHFSLNIFTEKERWDFLLNAPERACVAFTNYVRLRRSYVTIHYAVKRPGFHNTMFNARNSIRISVIRCAIYYNTKNIVYINIIKDFSFCIFVYKGLEILLKNLVSSWISLSVHALRSWILFVPDARDITALLCCRET